MHGFSILGKRGNAHAGSRTRVTSMGGLYDAATLRALTLIFAGRMLLMLQVASAMSASSMSFCVDPPFLAKEEMRTPGVKPGSQAWEACMMPLHYVRLWVLLRKKSKECRPSPHRFCHKGGRPGIEPALVWQSTQSFTHAVISAPFTFSQLHDFITSYHLTQ